jgi:hypothetical protein
VFQRVRTCQTGHEGKLWYHMIWSNCGVSHHASVEFASTIAEDVVHVFKGEKSRMSNVIRDFSLDCRYRLVPPRLKVARSSIKRTIKIHCSHGLSCRRQLAVLL